MDILLICGIIALFFYFLEKYYKKKLARLKSKTEGNTDNYMPIVAKHSYELTKDEREYLLKKVNNSLKVNDGISKPTKSRDINSEINLTKEDRELLIKEIVKNITPKLVINVENDDDAQPDDGVRKLHTYEVSLKGDISLLKAPEIPVEYNKIYKMQSTSEENLSYSINLFDMTCTCQDFIKNRVLYAKNDYRRACKHMYQKIRYLKESLHFTPEQLFRFSVGSYYKEMFFEIILKNGKFAGRKVTVGWSENNTWVSIVCAIDKYEDNFKRYGYNLVEKRWSYTSSPHGMAMELRETLPDYFNIIQLD